MLCNTEVAVHLMERDDEYEDDIIRYMNGTDAVP